ncbi:uncharacterized protein CTRU02_210335 [Colletotrichum truncatum]|uniref:Integral membrane protein n=1 Tax=Colletotrichum truncatum TaxID=5467 RepID=A0ACC3YUY6_COLTU
MAEEIENRGPELFAVGVTLVTTAGISIILRCYARIFLVKNFGFDDYCMVGAMVFFSLFVACAIAGIHYGTGRHYYDLDPADQSMAMKYWWFCYLWYCLSMICSKISIGWFLLRITVRKIDVWIIYTVMFCTVCTGVVFFFVTLLQCLPIPFFWDKSIKGHCVEMDVIIALTYLYSAFSVICDFTFAILPIILIWKLKMDRKTKVALVPIMAMACMFVDLPKQTLIKELDSNMLDIVPALQSLSACRSSRILRTKTSYVSPTIHPTIKLRLVKTLTRAPADATVDIAIWSTTEQGLAITAGSLATLRPLFRMVVHSLGFTSMGPSINDSERGAPSAMGGKLNASNSSSNRPRRGPFSLTTFMAKDDVEAHELGSNSDHEGNKQDKFASSKRSRAWGSQGKRDNESETELTFEASSKNSLGSERGDNIVVVRTFSLSEDRK